MVGLRGPRNGSIRPVEPEETRGSMARDNHSAAACASTTRKPANSSALWEMKIGPPAAEPRAQDLNPSSSHLHCGPRAASGRR